MADTIKIGGRDYTVGRASFAHIAEFQRRAKAARIAQAQEEISLLDSHGLADAETKASILAAALADVSAGRAEAAYSHSLPGIAYFAWACIMAAHPETTPDGLMQVLAFADRDEILRRVSLACGCDEDEQDEPGDLAADVAAAEIAEALIPQPVDYMAVDREQRERRAKIFEAMAIDARCSVENMIHFAPADLCALFCKNAGVSSVELDKLKVRLMEYLDAQAR